MDIIGKLPAAPGQRVFVLAITNYFTKWIEAEVLSKVRDREVIQFIWKNVICRFGVPKEIVTDNGTRFINTGFQNFCKEWNIKLNFSTPRYLQANGQAKSSNKIVMNTLKKDYLRLKENRQTSFLVSFGPTAPPFEHPPVKRPSRWFMARSSHTSRNRHSNISTSFLVSFGPTAPPFEHPPVKRPSRWFMARSSHTNRNRHSNISV
ncbi:uncharacterized protein LOC111403192 [Olea europaea var. sylvestris]|uniref:uncharacterized protein LOC111403192 n=1 Tax=Olea europaea var. sylvestris TaxID=158386 RepID=UPI000C1CD1C1|nr:uncharacterized protein LOC111403192 [Olea europaea var. sylvestris]